VSFFSSPPSPTPWYYFRASAFLSEQQLFLQREKRENLRVACESVKDKCLVAYGLRAYQEKALVLKPGWPVASRSLGVRKFQLSNLRLVRRYSIYKQHSSPRHCSTISTSSLSTQQGNGRRTIGQSRVLRIPAHRPRSFHW